MDAIVIAGGIPEQDDPLYPFSQGRAKALIDIAGKSMVQWVLNALDESQKVEQVVVIGLESGRGLACEKVADVIPDQGDMLQNIRVAARRLVELDPGTAHVLSVSADIPAIRGEIVDWTVGTACESDHDIYYSVIPRSVMEARFPGSRRSYVRLKDGEVCGGDMNVFRASLADSQEGIWERIIAARKNALKQAALIGYGTLFLLLLQRLTIQGAVSRASRRLGLDARALVSPYAEIGMDVDKPHQLEILRADLAAGVRR